MLLSLLTCKSGVSLSLSLSMLSYDTAIYTVVQKMLPLIHITVVSTNVDRFL